MFKKMADGSMVIGIIQNGYYCEYHINQCELVPLDADPTMDLKAEITPGVWTMNQVDIPYGDFFMRFKTTEHVHSFIHLIVEENTDENHY